MSEGEKDAGPSKPKPPGEDIIASASASIAGMFANVISALSTDVTDRLKSQASGESPAVQAAVVELTEQMIAMLAQRVTSAMPAAGAQPSQDKPAQSDKDEETKT